MFLNGYSFFILGQKKLSLKNFIIEFVCVCICLSLYFKYGFTIVFLRYMVLLGTLILISFIDYYYRIVPNILVVFGIVSVIPFSFSLGISIFDAFMGLFVGGGLFLLIAVLSNGAMGGGDIKLMGMIGFWLGWRYILLIAFLSFIIGGLASSILLILKLKTKKDYIAFAPFISISAFIAIYYGAEIIDLYILSLDTYAKYLGQSYWSEINCLIKR